MDRQEIFNKTWAWFSRPEAELAKRKPSIGGNDGNGPNCFYRHPEDDSRRCAIGCQIPDELYHPSMEGHDATELLIEYPEVRKLFGAADWDYAEAEGDEDETFLANLQACHDNAFNEADVLEALRRLAAEYNLVVQA